MTIDFYPYPVEDAIVKAIEAMDSFIRANGVDIDILIDLLGKPLMERYDANEPIKWQEGEIEDIMKKSIFLTTLSKLSK